MAGNLYRYATGTSNERKEDKLEENAASNCTYPASNPGDKATGEVDTIFGGGNGWGNESVPTSVPRTLVIPGGAVVMITKHAETLPAGENAPMSGTTSQNIHRALMRGNPTLYNTSVGGNQMGGVTWTGTAPPAAPQQVNSKVQGGGVQYGLR